MTFENRYGLTLIGDLYVPKNARGKSLVIAVSDSFGAVKKQTSSPYAQMLAERSFVTVALDGPYTDESLDTPYNVSSPEIDTEGFLAAADPLGSLGNINRDEIGILGVCDWRGFALNATVSDPRTKAVVTSMIYDMTRIAANSYETEVQVNVDGSYDRAPTQSTDACYKIKLDMSNAR